MLKFLLLCSSAALLAGCATDKVIGTPGTVQSRPPAELYNDLPDLQEIPVEENTSNDD